LDEVEKAHPEVFNILLQVFDEGRLTDNKGRTVNFKNTIIIMTSNIGAPLIMEKSKRITDENRELIYEEIRDELFQLLQHELRPEFLNRIDDIIVFHALDRNEIMQIVNLQFERVKKKLAENGIRVSISNEALLYLAAQGYQPEFGARPLKRLIQKEIVNALAKKIIEGSISKGFAVTIDCLEDRLVFNQNKEKTVKL